MPTNAVSCNSLSHTPLALGHTESVCIIDISLNYDDVLVRIPTNTRDQIRKYFLLDLTQCLPRRTDSTTNGV